MAVTLKLGAGTAEPSAPRELFTLPLRGSAAGATYESSRDGQRFLVLTNSEGAKQSLNVVVNWPVLLQQAATASVRPAPSDHSERAKRTGNRATVTSRPGLPLRIRQNR